MLTNLRILCFTFFAALCLEFIEPLHWSFEILRSASPYSYFALLICLLVLLFSRVGLFERIIYCIIFLVGTFIFLSSYGRFYFTANTPVGCSNTSVKILYANVLTSNQDYGTLMELIKKLNPDMVALVETDQRWIDNLGLHRSYASSIEYPRNDNFGMALYWNNLEFEESKAENRLIPLIEGTGRKNNINFFFSLIHVLPPMSNKALSYSLDLIKGVQVINNNSANKIVVGDFNSSPSGYLYKKFQRISRLKQGFEGYGYQRTWNAFNPILRFGIDHFFISSNLGIKQIKVAEPFGSDHLPLFGEFCLSDS